LGLLFGPLGMSSAAPVMAQPNAQTPATSQAPTAKAAATTPAISASEVGRDLFFDTELSNPVGMSCATCHAQAMGYTFPRASINISMGPVPGILPGHFGNRRTPTISYAVYLPKGPPKYDPSLTAFAGGLFWDGRAADLASQVPFPLQNPNEMNDTLHNLGDPALIVRKVAGGRYARRFMQVYGPQVFSQPTGQVLLQIAQAIAAFESSPEVSPFSSKYDAYVAGKATLSASEQRGLQLVTGSTTGRPGGPPSYKFAQCVLCHGIPSSRSQGPDLWTNTCYANIGVPKNPNNPYYTETNKAIDPAGYNAAGAAYVDLGLGDYIYPQQGLPIGNMGKGSNGKGDFLAINGTFKAPTLRNVDKRPEAGFVKSYMHNGVFKSLKQVVHFYNTRNLTSAAGEIIDFTGTHPYAGLKGKPLWAQPEYPSPITLQNPSGAPGSSAAQVGNLGLTDQEEDDIVAFLQTLSDGFTR
jgi:cytochrome c peroxidase